MRIYFYGATRLSLEDSSRRFVSTDSRFIALHPRPSPLFSADEVVSFLCSVRFLSCMLTFSPTRDSSKLPSCNVAIYTTNRTKLRPKEDNSKMMNACD